MTSKTIYVSKEAYKALKDMSSKQRGCKALTPEQYEKMFARMSGTPSMKNDLIRLDDNSMGGGDGTYFGKWTRWSVADIKKMLSELGFEWEPGEELNYAFAESPI